MRWDEVASITPLGGGPFYDLHVPGEEHYLAHGLWHHNTGKTTGFMWFDHIVASKNPNVRILWLRKTRESLTDSVMADFEDHVLGDQNHPLLHTGGRRQNRHSYHYPNGSYIRCAGVNNPEAYLSSQWDIIRAFQAEQLSLHDWATVAGRNRNFSLWFQQRGLDANPGPPNHWILKRLKKVDEDSGEPLMERYISRHVDNPAYWDAVREDWTRNGADYMRTLRALPGVLYQRNYLGEWVAAEGQVWPEYDEALHRVNMFIDGRYVLPDFEWYFASVDWGKTDPGVMQVWGVTEDGCLYRVVEIYRTEQQLDWWAARALELHAEFNLSAIVCDPSRNDIIDHFNSRLGHQLATRGGSKKHPWLALGADNRRASRGQDLGGLDLVRKYLCDQGRGGAPRLFFAYEAMRYGPDPLLGMRELPTCTEDEIPSYVNRTDAKTGEVVGDQPDDSCPDHGCDATRYAVTWHATYGEHQAATKPPQPEYDPGTIGALHRQREAERARERRRQREAI